MSTRILKTQEVAELFHVTPATVIRWANEGLLPCTRTLGKHRRFREEDVEALLKGTAPGTAA